MKKALVLEDKVIEVADTTFPISPPLKWIDCPDTTEVRWDVRDNSVVVPAVSAPSLEELKEIKLSELASYRWGRETGGLVIGSLLVSTDDRTKTLLNGARLKAVADPSYTADWKVRSGVFTALTAAQIIYISDAVANFVDHCFKKEKDHSDAIQALTTIEGVNEYDFTTGW